MSNEQIKSQAGRAVDTATADRTTPCIYCYRFPNGKEYIGQSWDLKRRHTEHIKGEGGCPAFHRAIKKYGWDKDKLPMVLIECHNQEQLNYWEQFFIKQRKARVPYGYNISGGGKGGKLHQQTKDKLRKYMLGDKNPNFGKPLMARLGYRKHPVVDGMKWCIGCLTHLPIESFYPGKRNGRIIYRSRCIDCFKKQRIERGYDRKTYIKRKQKNAKLTTTTKDNS